MLTTEMRGEDDGRGGRGRGVVGAEEGGDVHGGCGLDEDVGCASCLSYTRRRCARSSDHRHELYLIILFYFIYYVRRDIAAHPTRSPRRVDHQILSRVRRTHIPALSVSISSPV
jgi:hypothetical protein